MEDVGTSECVLGNLFGSTQLWYSENPVSILFGFGNSGYFSIELVSHTHIIVENFWFAQGLQGLEQDNEQTELFTNHNFHYSILEK